MTRKAGWLLAFLLVAPAALFAQVQTTFGQVSVGTTSSPITVTLTARTSGTITAIAALTGGQPNLDYAISDPGSCQVNTSLQSGQTCTVQVTLNPRYPGLRYGAVVLQSGSAQTLASTPVSGIGQGSLPVLVPATISTVAGDAEWNYQSDGVSATEAPIFLPVGLAVDAAGDLFLCDSENHRIREVSSSTGKISTVAGNGSTGSSGDGGAATSAALSEPSGLALDGAGNLYIADTGNNTIRYVDHSSGVISTIAGVAGQAGYSGDGGAATSALLNEPRGLALTPDGNLVVADSGNSAIRLLNLNTGVISTVAGTGVAGFSGDGGAATSATLNTPYGVAVNSNGMAIADYANQRVRFVGINGVISTIAGTGERNYGGDSQSATDAQLNNPAAVAFDPAGDLYIADSGNNRVRAIFGSPGTIVTVAGGQGEGFGGDGGPDNQASLYGPYALVFDAGGNLWISDMFNNRVREVAGSVLNLNYPPMKVGKVSAPIEGTLYNGGNTTLQLNTASLNEAALDSGTTTCNQASLAPMAFCNMGVEFAPTAVGPNITGSVAWTSNAPNVTPQDMLNGQVLSVEPTSVTLASSANPGLLGQPLTLTATVTSANASFSGGVTFAEGSTNWCSNVQLQSSGSGTMTASCVIQGLSLGTHTFVASYSGDEDDASSSSQQFPEIIKQQTALALSAPSPSVVTTTLTLTLTAQDQNGTASGTVVFYDGTNALGTVTLNSSGTATWNTSTLSVGMHALSAQYSGNSSDAPGTSNTVSEQIVQASTVTVLSSTSSSSTVGQPVTFSANVVSQNGPAPTGSVAFTDGSGTGAVVLATATLNANGTASARVTTLTPGTHNIYAVYSGDTDNAVSSSNALQEQVGQIGTVTQVSADANPLNAGRTLNLTAQVTLAPQAMAQGALTGTVTFSDGATVLGSSPINTAGQATLAVNGLAVGVHNLTAAFGGATNYAVSSSAVLVETVQQTATQSVLSSSATTTLAGKAAVLTATVVSATGVPTGVIVFHDGTAQVGTATLNANGVATLSLASLAVGAHTLTASYAGDVNYLPSVSAAVLQNVVLAQPVLTLTGPSGAVDAGTNSQFTASLNSPGLAPTGTLRLLDGSVPVGSVNVAANGSFVFNTNQLAVGTHTLVASYSGDVDTAQAVSAPITLQVKQANTAVGIAASVNPLTLGSGLTLTATLTTDSPNAQGMVSFYDGSASLGQSALASSGTASLQISNLGFGLHSITAVYAGDVNHLPSTSPSVEERVVQPVQASLTSSVNPSASGQNVTLTVAIAAATHAVGGAAPTGTVLLYDNGAMLASVPLQGNGTGSFSTAALAVGSHSLTLSYAGDNNFAAAAAQLGQTVTEASTGVGLTVGSNPATYGQPETLTAVVSSNGGIAAGQVEFLLDGTTPAGTAPLNASGIATLTTSTLPPGTHSVTARYLGNGNADASASAPVVLSIRQATSMSLTSSSNPGQTLSAITITTSLSGATATPATGSVTFMDGGSVLGTAVLDASGHAAFTAAQLTAGVHTLTATYPGDAASFPSNAAAYSETINLRPTVTTVTGSSTDLSNPQQVTLIAVVKGNGSVPPGGLVTFTSGSLTLGAASVDATGVADITVIFSSTTMPVVASYSGDTSYAASQSASSSIVAGQPAQFTLNVSSPNITLVTHQHATVSLTLSSIKGFTDTVALGCLGLPYAATCTFTNPKLQLDANGNISTTLIVDTGDPLGAGTGATASVETRGGKAVLLCWLPAGLLLGGLRRKRAGRLRQQLGALLLLLAAVMASTGLSGCGGLNMSGTAPGSYSFKVVGTGQGSGVTQTETVTLVVTQ